jgi:hypothetical protein
MLLLVFGFSDFVGAATLRCGSKVIQVGDSDRRVRTHCGEPTSIERETRSFPDGGALDDRCFFGTVTVEKWNYERGYSGIPATVMVVDGKVERIRLQTGGYETGWASPCQ